MKERTNLKVREMKGTKKESAEKEEKMERRKDEGSKKI